MDRQIRGSSGPLYSSRMVKWAPSSRREETIAGAMEAGADGFLAKDASSQQVAEAIRTLVDGSGSIVAEAEPAALPRYAM